MDVDTEFSFEVFCNPVCRRAPSVFSFLRRIPFQEGLDLFFDLLGDFLWASLPLSVIEARRTFLVEPTYPFSGLRSGHVVDLRNFWGRVAPTAEQNDVGAYRHSAYFLSFHALQLIALFIGRLADGSVGHNGGNTSAKGRGSLHYIDD